jgi:uncharacterized protein (TIGR02646 family)
MRFKQIQGNVFFTQNERALIAHLEPLAGHEWQGKLPGKSRGSRKKRNLLKTKIKVSLDELQGDNCCFCGLSLYETSGAYIEHIAPKAQHPQFMFNVFNLALACSYCNGFEKKSTHDTISTLNANYNNCEFNIVHPYFDNPDDHFSVADYDAGGLILNYDSPQAIQSRDLFDLAGTNQTSARGKQFMHEELRTDPETELKLKAILNTKYIAKT